MKARPVLILLLFISHYCIAQRGNNWVFGNNAWINFTTSPPTTGNSAMMQLEGSSTISDENGNLLFYSDGVKVWNANHQVMPNGSGLQGDMSSTQSSMIIPFPGDPKRYYLFTMAVINGPKGLSYSIVNMDLDNGNGDIETKNVFLIGPSTEKVTSVNHCNGKDVWVMTSTMASDNFYAFLVTASGINPPVVSSAGAGLPYFGIGYLKFSPDGTKMACGNLSKGLDLFDFDAATGIVTNRKIILSGNNQYPYGMEFSADSKLLYVANGVRISSTHTRFDLCQYGQLSSSPAAIIATRYELDNITLGVPLYFSYFNALQLGPDGKIYIALFGGQKLGLISYPGRQAAACSYVRAGFTIANNSSSTYGLPDFNQSYFKSTFTYDISCVNNDVNFFSTRSGLTNAVKWDFGDPASGAGNTSTIDSPSHTFSSPGIYEVTLIAYMNCRNDTMKKKLVSALLKQILAPTKTFVQPAHTFFHRKQMETSCRICGRTGL